MTPSQQQASRADAAARRIVRESLEESLIVEASAGTGKTTELVARIVQVLAKGLTTVDRIVAVTFTHKAAGELKIRLRQELDKARAAAADAGERERLEQALKALEEAAIGTIHGFCAQILRQRPVEARVDPAFEEITEQEAGRIYDRAFNQWFQRKLGESSPGLRRALARLAWREAWESGPAMDQLRFAGRKLVEWRDFPALWRREPFNRESAVESLLAHVAELAQMASHCKRANDNLANSLRPLQQMLTWLDRTQGARKADYDTLEALLLKLQRDVKKDSRKGSGFFADGVRREDVLDSRQRLLHSLEEFRQRAGADLAAELRAEMQDLVVRYTDLKARAGKLDFVDLLLLACQLLKSNSEVRHYFQQRFSHIFVDEFQDTDPLQAAILVLLASSDPEESDWLKVKPSPGKLFLVGDPKQSIYKFRRADVTLYQHVCGAFEGCGVRRIALTRSYRSVRGIQQFVNAAFTPEMTGDVSTAQAAYSTMDEDGPEHRNQPSVIALPAPRPYGSSRISKERINACLPDAIGGFLDWLIKESGWKVRNIESGELVAVEARHVCILFRRFTNWGVDMTRDYVKALESRGLPHLLVGSKSFHHREEVETLRTALTAIEWPEDELSVFATLRGSLFAIPDSLLLRFHGEFGRLHPFRKYPDPLDPDFQEIAEALKVLGGLHRSRNWRPIADTVNALLEAVRAHAGFAMRPTGHQALANVYRICDLARSFELSGGISFRGFVEELMGQAEKADSPEALVLEEAADGVRLMTVHTAKGLEFPVVVLADLTANLAAADPDRYLDTALGLCATRLLRCAPWELIEHEAEEKLRERAEGVRVAYVAATRARDLLIVPAVGDEERDGWLAPLNKAIYPAQDKWRHPQPASYISFQGIRTVLDRPLDSISQDEPSVKPGLHTPRCGQHAVMWWDPAALKLNAPENFGLRQVDILEPLGAASESIALYTAWKEARARSVERGQAKDFDVVIATALNDPPPGAAAVVTIDSVAKAVGTPGGLRFGALLHGILRDSELTASREQVHDLAQMHGKLLDASGAEIEAAVDAVVATLQHPLLRRAAAAERCHRELPLLLPLGDGRTLEGVVDLAFLENGEWTVVDFKTDSELSANKARYERQVQWYVHALSKLTGLPAKGVILWNNEVAGAAS
jgi:ATP-dependent helicase/nuclease subunit A